jgi:hypothetical protein
MLRSPDRRQGADHHRLRVRGFSDRHDLAYLLVTLSDCLKAGSISIPDRCNAVYEGFSFHGEGPLTHEHGAA